MSNIVFFILHEVGSLNASLQLAMDLKMRGHTVTYVGLADSEALIRANGFEFSALFHQHFPKNTTRDIADRNTLLRGVDYLLAMRRTHMLLKSFIEYLIAGGDEEFFTVIEATRPDLIIFTGVPFVEWAVLMAYARGVQGVYLRPTLSPREGTGMPPVTSTIIPRLSTSFWQNLRIRFAWRLYDFRNWLYTIGFDGLTRKLANKYGIRNYRHETVYAKDFSVTLPEIIPFHPDFDFFEMRLPDQRYIGTSVCLRRHEAAFPWEKIDSNKRLAYCALGTYLWRSSDKYRQFFRTVLDAARMTPDWQWVVAIGQTLGLDALGPVPDNVIIVENAPQIGMLKRASVMITHGGANTVKECIALGVPMVIFPLGGDHHGIAARAAYHGLAMRAEFGKTDAARLKLLIEAVTTNSFIRTQLRLMQSRFAEMEAANIGVKTIELFLPSSAPSVVGSDVKETSARATTVGVPAPS